jgi:hypothetical protein
VPILPQCASRLRHWKFIGRERIGASTDTLSKQVHAGWAGWRVEERFINLALKGIYNPDAKPCRKAVPHDSPPTSPRLSLRSRRSCLSVPFRPQD